MTRHKKTHRADHQGTYHDGSSATNRYDFLGQLTNSIDAAGVAVPN
jgi:hypothetical protein